MTHFALVYLQNKAYDLWNSFFNVQEGKDNAENDPSSQDKHDYHEWYARYGCSGFESLQLAYTVTL